MKEPRPISVVITRSPGGNEELASRLKLIGLDPITVDTIRLVPPESWDEVDRALRMLDTFDLVALTSPTGVAFFARRMKELSLALPRQGKLRFAAVGRQTAEALSGLGVKVDFVPPQFTTLSLGEELPAKEGESALLLRSEEANPVLERKLAERGLNVHEVAMYRTVPIGGAVPKISATGMIVFASPSAVRNFCSMLSEPELRRVRKLKTVCIGPVTEAAAREKGFAKVALPRSFTIDGVVGEIRRLSEEIA
jgi:uroporphyrinogen III methyltransferase/synthase